MSSPVGRRIVVESERVGRSPRRGAIEEVLHRDPPRYRVRWDDARTTTISPASGALWIEGADDPRAEAVDKNSELCRSVNERIRELEGARIGTYDFVCECTDGRCTHVMRMSRQEYQAVRADPRQFAVLPGHERPWSEEVLSRNDRYAVVRKPGAGEEKGRADRASRPRDEPVRATGAG